MDATTISSMDIHVILFTDTMEKNYFFSLLKEKNIIFKQEDKENPLRVFICCDEEDWQDAMIKMHNAIVIYTVFDSEENEVVRSFATEEKATEYARKYIADCEGEITDESPRWFEVNKGDWFVCIYKNFYVNE